MQAASVLQTGLGIPGHPVMWRGGQSGHQEPGYGPLWYGPLWLLPDPNTASGLQQTWALSWSPSPSGS